jgi:hypothetical protein
MKKAISVLALLCMLASLAYARTDKWRFRAGLRNSPGSQRLSAMQLQSVLDSLRHKTGFLSMRFDEEGFLTLGDRTRIGGGSATARELLIAAVEGDKAFELESHDRSSTVAFARIGAGPVYNNFTTKARITIEPLQLDFADFAQLHGSREALAAFDIGFAVLHELAHGVYRLRDTTDPGYLGECERHINRMRRELGLPERQRYIARVRKPAPSESTIRIEQAELLFVCVSQTHGQAGTRRFFYLKWDAKQVASAAETAWSR